MTNNISTEGLNGIALEIVNTINSLNSSLFKCKFIFPPYLAKTKILLITVLLFVSIAYLIIFSKSKSFSSMKL